MAINLSEVGFRDKLESRLYRDPIEAAQQLIQRPVSTEELYARQGMVPPEAKVEPIVEEPKVEEPMVKAEEPEPTVTEPMDEEQPIVKKEPTIYPRLEKAKELYPYLKDKDFDYTEQLTDDEKAGFLEFWEPGDEGPPDGSVKRPEAIGLDRMGIEVRNDKTRPIDILGDYVSHEAVKSDPKLKDIYDRYISTVTEEQLRTKYEYEKKNYGEDRPFEQWKERSGLPGMFRGYTFNQFSEKEIEEAYTPEQLDILDEAKEYLNINIDRVKTQEITKEEPIQIKEEVLPEVQEPVMKEEKQMTDKDMKEYDRAVINEAYDNLLKAEGTSGDTTGAAKTRKRGLTDEQYKRQVARLNNPNLTDEEASKAYLEELYITFNNEIEGFSKLDYDVKSDILHEAYNLGMGVKNYKNFTKAIKENNPEQIFFNLLDTANISGQTSKGIAVRRAELYNKYADAKIKTVEQLEDGTLIYSTEKGELFRYRRAKHNSSKAGKVKL